MEVVEGGASSLAGRIPSLPRGGGKTLPARLSSALVAVVVVDLSLGEDTEDQWAMEARCLTRPTGATGLLEDMGGLEARVSQVGR